MTLEIRRPTRAELDIAMDWTTTEGWNLGVHDAEFFYNYGTEGYLIALRNGEPVGFFGSILMEPAFAAADLFIVKPGLRNYFVGRDLGRAALRLIEDRNASAPAVKSKVRNYRFHGFKTAYGMERCEGVIGVYPADPGLVDLREIAAETLMAYDRICYPVDRARLITQWIHYPGAVALGLLKENGLAGYGVMRKAVSGFRIEPLYADDAAIAVRLLSALLARATPGDTFFLDLPDVNPGVAELRRRFALRPLFAMVRMFSKFIPDNDVTRIYGEYL